MLYLRCLMLGMLCVNESRNNNALECITSDIMPLSCSTPGSSAHLSIISQSLSDILMHQCLQILKKVLSVYKHQVICHQTLPEKLLFRKSLRKVNGFRLS